MAAPTPAQAALDISNRLHNALKTGAMQPSDPKVILAAFTAIGLLAQAILTATPSTQFDGLNVQVTDVATTVAANLPTR